MKMSDNPTKHEVLTEQYLHSILDISAYLKKSVWIKKKNKTQKQITQTFELVS